MRAQTHTPGPGGDSPRRVTRAWASCLYFGRTLLDMVTMCDLHVSIVVLAVGLALSLHYDMLASDLIICLARPHGSWIFFAKPCRTWWRSAPRDVSDIKKLCLEVSVVMLQMPFTWDFIFTVLHMQHAHTHIPFQKFAIALAIGFSFESMLKYERLKQKKNLSECLVGF